MTTFIDLNHLEKERPMLKVSGEPCSGIQAPVVLQTQTLNAIRCWSDNDTGLRLVFCTYQGAVFTINILGENTLVCCACVRGKRN